MTLIECNALTKKYGNFTALSNLDLQIESGHIIGLLGPNGSGKTTLLKLITGLLQPSSGTISINGEPVGAASKSLISYLPDHTYLDRNMRVRDAMDFFEDFYQNFDSMRAYEMLAQLAINPNHKLKTLSKGTQEKVDPAARDFILNTILSNYDENASILISTHLISDIENILDEVIFIQNGNLHTHASVDDLRQKEHKSIDTIFREVFKC